jgi:hypothetical protein
MMPLAELFWPKKAVYLGIWRFYINSGIVSSSSVKNAIDIFFKYHLESINCFGEYGDFLINLVLPVN